MPVIRPTLRVMSQLPRESFPDPTMFDEVKKLKSLPLEARQAALKRITLDDIDHGLVNDARSYLAAGITPDLHKSSTASRKEPVYEVRNRQGAAWRGAVIIDQNGDWWLVYAERHDHFHANAAKFFGSNASDYLPSNIDEKLKEWDRIRRQELEEDKTILLSFSQALEQAIKSPGRTCKVLLPDLVKEKDRVLVTVTFPETADSPSTMHETIGEVSVIITIDMTNKELRDRLLGLCVPFIQPDPAMRDQVYTSDYRSIHLDMFVSQARLAQFLATSKIPHTSLLPDVPEPIRRHWAGQKVLTEAFVNGSVIQALCGEWFVPTRDGEALPELPICLDCEAVEPLAQQLHNLIRDLSNDV